MPEIRNFAGFFLNFVVRISITDFTPSQSFNFNRMCVPISGLRVSLMNNSMRYVNSKFV